MPAKCKTLHRGADKGQDATDRQEAPSAFGPVHSDRPLHRHPCRRYRLCIALSRQSGDRSSILIAASSIGWPKESTRPTSASRRCQYRLGCWRICGAGKTAGSITRHFVEFNGEAVTSVKTAFKRAVKLAGLPGKVSPHTLRHTAATWLMQAGADRWQAAGYLGMSVEMLERVYGHHHPDHLQNAVARDRQRKRTRTESGRIWCGFWCGSENSASEVIAKSLKYWWAREDSNLQPDRYERSALTIELQARSRSSAEICNRRPYQRIGAAASRARRHIRSSRLALPLNIFALSSSHSGTVFIHSDAGRIDHERPVDREQDAVDAHLLHAAHQRRIGEVAAGGDPEIVAENVAEADRLGCARPRDARDRCARPGTAASRRDGRG